MVLASPTSVVDAQNSRAAIFGRIWASRCANFPGLPGCRRYDPKILRTSRTRAIGHDVDVLEPRRICGLKDIWPDKTKGDKETEPQANPMRAFPLSGQHISLTAQS